MTASRATRSYLIARILAGLLALFFVYSTISRLIGIVTVLRLGLPPEVIWVYSAETAAFAVFSVICALYVRRGDRPSARRQSLAGCLFALGTAFIVMFIGGLAFAMLSLEESLEAALNLATVSLGGALGGILGLYVGRPSSSFLGNKARDKNESAESTGETFESIRRKRARQNSVGIAAITALGAAYLGFGLLPFTTFLSRCIPDEALSDSGFALGLATISCLISIVAAPLAMLMGGLLAYGTFERLDFSEGKTTASWMAAASGGLSGLIFLIISIVVFHAFLCVA